MKEELYFSITLFNVLYHLVLNISMAEYYINLNNQTSVSKYEPVQVKFDHVSNGDILSVDKITVEMKEGSKNGYYTANKGKIYLQTDNMYKEKRVGSR